MSASDSACSAGIAQPRTPATTLSQESILDFLVYFASFLFIPILKAVIIVFVSVYERF